MDLGLTGKVALITGGSHGLGRATARAFALEGVRVVICGRHAETLQSAADAITTETGVAVLPIVADVLDPAALERLVADATAAFGTIDILVNNADVLTRQARDFFDVGDDEWIEKFNVKILAPVRLMRLVAPGMIERGWGRILNIGGAATRRLLDTEFAKGAAQAGLVNVTKKVAHELGRHGITVNIVEPGGMWTDGKTVAGRSRADTRHEALERAAEEAGITYDEMDARERADLVIGRRIDVEDGAGLIVFLCSERAGTITGEVVVADGGETRSVRY
jgi:NAD(P)-dependent dehydrogenase (short-subunit alcohol dehydrogenase family)